MLTLSIFYYAYLLVVLFFVIFSLFNLYHLMRFGFLTLSNLFIMILYIVMAISLLIFSFDILMQIDWTVELNITTGSSSLSL